MDQQINIQQLAFIIAAVLITMTGGLLHYSTITRTKAILKHTPAVIFAIGTVFLVWALTYDKKSKSIKFDNKTIAIIAVASIAWIILTINYYKLVKKLPMNIIALLFLLTSASLGMSMLIDNRLFKNDTIVTLVPALALLAFALTQYPKGIIGTIGIIAAVAVAIYLSSSSVAFLDKEKLTQLV